MLSGRAGAALVIGGGGLPTMSKKFGLGAAEAFGTIDGTGGLATGAGAVAD